jgi:hypothetical protein
MIFKLPPQFGQWSISISKTRPTHARRRTLRVRVIACGLGCLLYRTGNDFTAQLRIGREHAMEAD